MYINKCYTYYIHDIKDKGVKESYVAISFLYLTWNGAILTAADYKILGMYIVIPKTTTGNNAKIYS
jgi:hypothetical protein